MGEIVKEGAERPMNMRMLPAAVAMGADQGRAAVQAVGFVRVPVTFAGCGFDRPTQHPASYRVSYSFDFSHHEPPRAILGGLDGSC